MIIDIIDIIMICSIVPVCTGSGSGGVSVQVVEVIKLSVEVVDKLTINHPGY